ncbi:hypothetical protein [Gordonia sp. NPDC127522]|uniref:hypothetical protein n=1 Tax=Gordonia sp. NPDC127522 TaxID=3345390 RepID=UPI003640A7B7
MPLLVADVLVALRNAIEHTLFAEVEFRDGRLSDDLAKKVEIPATKSDEDFLKWVGARDKKGPASLKSGSDLVARIERLQPYHLGDDHRLHPLARLALHTNHAKHREPAVTAVRIAAMYDDHNRPQTLDEVATGAVVPLNVGEVIGEVPLGVQVPMTMFPNLGINRPLTDEWPQLLGELKEIFDWVREEALPCLMVGAAPDPPLPCRYEISVGHDDVRGALVEGSDVSAVTRHAQRLVAAAARIDLAEHIAEIDTKTPPELVTRWFDHLSDDEVIDWADRLAGRPQLDPPTRRRYLYRTLLKMRDAAVEFSKKAG